ncbi:GntR family transcriptional regulator [Phycisphaerales bacterium AB-hyl4]|uniref:GntR family transcriptional regulator n=1 Tax=Natronomicrosphaera hydrolytica TaxID=3242702 RepID=A0ABV4U205_9BACT
MSEAIEAGIRADRLAVGQRMPSDKALARDLHVSPLTVAKAYQKLAEKGMLDRHVGRGTFVARKSRRTGVVVMLTGDYVESWTGVVASGLSAALAGAGFRLEMVPPFGSDPLREREMLEEIDPDRVDGIFAMTQLGSEPLYRKLVERGVSVVLGGRHYASLPYVAFNDFHVGEMAAEHLRKIGISDCMAIIDNYDVGRERLHGFQTGLAKAGIELPSERVFFTGGPTLSEHELESLLQWPRLPQGIFAHGDSYLVQLYHGLLNAGRVEEANQLVMVGVGNRFEHHHVPFASVDYNLLGLGAEAGKYLIELIEGNAMPTPGKSVGREIEPVLCDHSVVSPSNAASV